MRRITKRLWLALVLVGCLAGLAPAQFSPLDPTGAPALAAQAGEAQGGAAPGVVSHVITSQGAPHTLVLVDTVERAIGVYHIDPQTGKIKLMSVRPVSWDLKMTEYNTEKPTPQDVRAGLNR
ncbi:hypothetical protein Mal64_00590 [Pseudobythopirellula maris]|uniref:Uncharacterized protein n=1 Tax=Pseudobythopirellula maris TaxID=2527991 RepID=A0A5C5ZQX5_9BACT|nr:hypothetical protein [Pseudobythopirellula maris]TWT89680.1 hypothetical protein Mal64_00590 [Pseudobythopirellula maris]